MIGKIPGTAVALAVAALLAAACAAISAATASASTQVVYNNLNTVAPTVNGLPNEDTYSLDYEYFPIGGMVEFSRRPGVLKAVTTEIDSFTCEHGVYYLENCYTLHPTKKFSYELTADLYEVGSNNEPVGAPFASDTQKFRVPYRPTTNVSCPVTSEGKGFGANCDVGGYLAKITFKKFARNTVLPEKAIIVITNTVSDATSDIVNVGLQAAYKEYKEGEFIEEPAADGGVPAVGADPLPKAIFVRGALNETENWEGFQPVFEVTAAQ